MRRNQNDSTRVVSLMVLVIGLFVSDHQLCESFLFSRTGITGRIPRPRKDSVSSVMEIENPTHKEKQPSYVLIEPTSSGTDSRKSTAKLWKQLCPPLWKKPRKGTKDVTLIWSCCDDTQRVATELLNRLTAVGPTNKSKPAEQHDPRMVENVAQSLEQFRDFCTENLRSTSSSSRGHDGYMFKVRIVATRGPSGTKCPQWHVDHVPVRWIQSLAGPGCEMVTGNDSINWKLLINGLNNNNNAQEDNDTDDEFVVLEESVQDRNRALVETDAKIYSAREQESVLLIGNRWVDYAKDGAQASTVPPVLHKSPTIPWGLERVLLTQDVVLDDYD
jgi:hypothetical protein